MITISEKVSAIIPAYNEEQILSETVIALSEISKISEIIIIDDGSTDSTSEVIYYLIDKTDMNIKTLQFSVNRGKGAALLSGVEISNNNIIALVDADLGKSATEVKKLFTPVLNNQADMTIAKFNFKQQKIKGGFGFVKNLAKMTLKIITKENIESVLSGQRVMSKNLAQQLLSLEKNSKFGVEWGITVEALQKGVRIEEVEVNMDHRWTGRNLPGIFHRTKQFTQILITFLRRLCLY